MTTKKRFLAVEEYIIIILFSSMIIILASQVFTRYILSFTLPWAEQLTRVMFVWITFAGISLAVSKRMHLRVTAITMIIPEMACKSLFSRRCDCRCIWFFYVLPYLYIHDGYCSAWSKFSSYLGNANVGDVLTWCYWDVRLWFEDGIY